MGEKEVNISTHGLRKLNKSRIVYDFTFIVGNNHYNCPWFVAEFISSRVSFHRSVDITMNEFVIETKDPGTLFENIISLGWGSKIFVNENTFSFFISIAVELCNWELYFGLHDIFDENVSISKFFQEFCENESKNEYEMTSDFSEEGIMKLIVHF
jgi:hypothetical protein